MNGINLAAFKRNPPILAATPPSIFASDPPPPIPSNFNPPSARPDNPLIKLSPRDSNLLPIFVI